MSVPDQTGVAEPRDTLDKIKNAAFYLTYISQSLHPPEVEAALVVACELTVQQNDVYVEYLRGKGSGRRGRPNYEKQSPRWCKAEAARFASVRTVAAMLYVLHPSPNGLPPIVETQTLIDNRTGPLCNGWEEEANVLLHHTDTTCPIHGNTSQTHRKRESK